MSVQINKAHIYGINDGTDPGAISLFNPDGKTLVITGYLSPKLSSLGLTHESASEEIVDQFGEVDQVFYWREKFSMAVEIIPRAGNLADRIKTAAIPKAGGLCAIRRMPVLEAGSVADVLNTTDFSAVTVGAAQQIEWIYPGGASWNFVDEGKMTLSLPLVRYPGIASPVDIT